VESIATLAGKNVLSVGTGATYGTCLVNLKLFPPPSVPGYGNASGFELRLLDKTGRGDFGEMERIVGTFIQDLKARPEIAGAFTIFNASFPQYTLALDMERAAQKGVTAENALATLQTMLGSEYATR